MVESTSLPTTPVPVGAITGRQNEINLASSEKATGDDLYLPPKKTNSLPLPGLSFHPGRSIHAVQSLSPNPNFGSTKSSKYVHPKAPAYPHLNISNSLFSTRAHLGRDGRVHIKFRQLSQKKDAPLSSLIDSSLKQQFSMNLLRNLTNFTIPVLECVPPRLNIVIMVIGSRGDIQPFIAIAKVLVGEWGQHVRLATHPEFKELIDNEFRAMEEDIKKAEEEDQTQEESTRAKPRIKGGKGEFFSVGGNPQELMAFMVKNPGLLPSLETIKGGEVARRRKEMGVMFEGFWRSCVEPSKCTLVEESDMIEEQARGGLESAKDTRSDNTKKGKLKSADIRRLPGTIPFIADAIIANPPSLAHIHCAEKLGIPLHLMFTFPYTPTATIPHPLANIKQSDFEAPYTNIISYSMVEIMTWQGLGDLVNHFRKDTLGLEPISTLWAPGLVTRLKVPTTYMWSPSLIPKPADWGPDIDISGFVFLGKADTFTPSDDLKAFLDAEPENPPIYIGFGSIVIDDPDSLTQLIFNAVNESGVRALVAKGWGELGGEEIKPDSVFMLDNTPHDWLFPKCRAVIHHGGAGTTAIGLKSGKATFIVTFFGDQPFWGQMVKNAGAGDWTTFKHLNLAKLIDGIQTVIAPEAADNAMDIAKKIAQEGDGAQNAVMSFYRALETAGVTKNVGERGRKKKKRKERRSDVNLKIAVDGLENGALGNVGVTNITAAAATQEGSDRGANNNLTRGVRFFSNPRVKDATSDNSVGQVNFITEPIRDNGIRCTLLPEAVAVWRVRRTRIKLSALAAFILVSERNLVWNDLRLVRHYEWNDFEGPGEPLSGGTGAIATALGGVAMGLFRVPYTWYKGVKHLGEDNEAEGQRKNVGKVAEDSKLTHNKKASEDRRDSISTIGSSTLSSQVTEPYRSHATENGGYEEYEEEVPISESLVYSTTHSLTSVLRTSLRLPMDVCLAVAQGFHNAPRLYGDTVRRPNRITGLHSGLRAAGKEVTLGAYDTITGLITKPYDGGKANGAIGFASGVGKAMCGVFFTIGAGLAGTVGYTLKGVHKELHKGPERAVITAIRDQRIWQGELEDADLCQTQRREEVVKRVLEGWQEEERKEFEKVEEEAELKRKISGVREIGWGAAKLRQLKKRADRRRKSERNKLEKGGRGGKPTAMSDRGEEEK